MESEQSITIQDKLITINNEIDIVKKTGAVKGKNNKVMYKHETIESILLVLNPILKKHSCAVYFDESDTGDFLNCNFIATGVSGSITTKCKMLTNGILQRGNSMQEKGSGLTYARRYLLRNLFNLSCEDDDATSVNKPKPESVASKIKLIMQQRGYTGPQVNELIKNKFQKNAFKELTDIEKKQLVGELEQHGVENKSDTGKPKNYAPGAE